MTAEQLRAAAAAVRPFTLKPAVLDAIRPMQRRDAEAMAHLHHAAMGQSLWARLGVRFLKTLYRALLDDARFLSFVHDDGSGQASGFIAGSLDPDAMMAATFRRTAPALAAAAFPGAASPRVLGSLLQTPMYARVSSAVPLPVGVRAESLFCTFAPRLRGTRVAGHINKVLFDDLLARGEQYVKVTTEIDNTAANRQLRSWGFADAGGFRFYGKEMVVYVLDLVASPRVQPTLRHPRI